MAEIELADDSLVGVLVRTRIRQFEEKHTGASVYVSNIRGVWEIRFTYGKGKEKHGTAYVSVPEATGWIARMHWPVGGKADITKL
ncbi:MAG: hypothetical protein LUQ17_02500, partial [Methanomicrobiales archaeon]|nr:hypothetical protein [Methanomicrobiales archaeon]